MKDWTNTTKRKAVRNAALFLILFLAAATMLAKGPKEQKAAPAAQDHKYKIASGADQVLSAVYDPSTNTIRVSGAGSGGGTVTNVGLSMPSTFNVTGGPITSSGTLSVNWAQPVSIANGGTGQTSASSAFNALAPPTAAGGLIYGTGLNAYGSLALGSSGQCLGSNGSTLVWTACGSGSVLTFGGDLSGTSTSQTVIGLQGHPISASAPAGGQVLEWSSSANAWTPSALPAFGTVSSVGLSLPNIFTVSGSPVTSSGALSAAFASQSANLVLASPNGASGAPSFRALTLSDIPTISFSNLSGTASLGQLPSINFSNLAGTAADSQLASAYSGVGTCASGQLVSALTRNAAPACAAALAALTAPAHEWFNAVSAAGVFTASQPSFLDLSGAATLAQLPVSIAQFTGTITANDCAKWSSSGVLTDAGAACGTSGSSATFQVNGANAGSQTAINFQSGGYITVTNPSAGNIQFNFIGPLALANGGTGLTTPGASGQCLGSNGTAMIWQSCGGSGLVLETNGVNDAGQSSLNLVNGANITFSNTLGGTVSASVSGTLSPSSVPAINLAATGNSGVTGILAAANGGTGLNSLGSAGQCLTSTGATALWGSCGGSALPAGWAQNGSTGAVLAQPLSNQDAVPLTVASALSSGGTADIFDVCQTSPCTATNKFFGVSWNGNLDFQASNLQLNTTGPAPYLYLNGIGGNPGQPYLKYATAQLNAPSCPVSSSPAGGTVAVGTYFFKCTWVNGAGETTASAETSVTTTGTTSAITLTAPGAQYSAFGYQIYESKTSGSELLEVPTSSNCALSGQTFGTHAVCAPTANATLTTTPSGLTYSPPTTNTTGGAFISAWAPSADGLGMFLANGAPGADAPLDAGLALPGGTGVNLTSGATITLNTLACLSASNTVSQCGANAANTIIGVFAGSGQNSLVQTTGIATLNLASAGTTTYNDYACSNATVGTIVDNGSAPCASGQQVGIIAQTNATVVTSVPVYLRFGGGSSGGGSSSAFQVNGTNLSSSSTINWLSGGPIVATNTSAGNVQFTCPVCLLTNPSATQTITPANSSTEGLAITSNGGTTTDAFDVSQNGWNSIKVNGYGQVFLGHGPSVDSLGIDSSGTGTVLNFNSPKDRITFSSSASGDIDGTIAVSSAASASVTFPLAYTSAPVCTLTPTSNPGPLTWWVTTSTTAVTANLSVSGTLTFNYVCMGNPN